MREEFWEKAKQRGGSSQSWDAIKVACEAMAEGSMDLAETVLQSARISTANGTLAVCYDYQRRKYEIPRYCWCTPVNVRDGVVGALTGSKTAEDITSEPLAMSVRIAFTPILIKLDVTTTTTILEVKQAVHEHLAPRKEDVDDTVEDDLPVERQRMFFGGRELNDTFTLAACGVKKQMVVQVAGRPTQEQQTKFRQQYLPSAEDASAAS